MSKDGDVMKLIKIASKDVYLLFEDSIDMTDDGIIVGMLLATTDSKALPDFITVALLKKDNIDAFIIEDEENTIWDVKVSKNDEEIYIHLANQLL
jgi:hypothetical protein